MVPKGRFLTWAPERLLPGHVIKGKLMTWLIMMAVMMMVGCLTAIHSAMTMVGDGWQGWAVASVLFLALFFEYLGKMLVKAKEQDGR